MNRYIVRSAVAAALVFTTGTAWARGPSIRYPGRAEGKVAEVNAQQQTVTMDDGTLLSATSAQQLSQLEPGSSVVVDFVDNGDRKDITDIQLAK